MPAQERPRSYSSDLSTSSPNFFRFPEPDPEPITPTDNLLSSLESDDNYVAVSIPIITYQPIPIPREPTLEEILQEASGTTELPQVKRLKLCVISDNLSLQRIATYCPLLTSLTLEGSALATLRELGCMMTSLRYLDVSRCGLRTLDGTSGLGSVTHLVANNNQIEYLDPCSFLDELEELSVQGNVIRTTYNFSCLSRCPLRTLHINGNPIEELPNFQEAAKRIIPRLIFLNGERIREEEVPGNGCEEESISTGTSSSGSFSSIEKSLDSFNIHGSSTTPVTQPSSQPQPPASSSGRPISADALLSRRHRPLSASLFRLRDRHRSSLAHPAWSSPPVAVGGGGTNSDAYIFDKNFPSRLPQTPVVELELGVIGTILEQSRSAFSASTDTQSVLRLASRWRELRGSAKAFDKKRPESAKGRLAGYDVILSRTQQSAIIDESSELSLSLCSGGGMANPYQTLSVRHSGCTGE